MKRQGGQAMAELVVIVAVLIPLFLLISLVAKYGHAKQMAQQSARNAAFAAAAAPNYRLQTQAALNAQARDQAFARSDAVIRTNPPSSTADFGDQMTNTFSGRPLIKRSGLNGKISETASPGWVSKGALLVPAVGGTGYPPSKEGYVTAHIDLEFDDIKFANGMAAKFLSPFDALNLKMNRKQVLLADPWNASGPGWNNPDRRSVMTQTRSLAPSNRLSELNKLGDVLGLIPLPMTSRLDKLDIGTVQPDIVPYERLDRYPVK